MYQWVKNAINISNVDIFSDIWIYAVHSLGL